MPSNTERNFVQVIKSGIKAERNWKSWLISKPLDWVTTTIYIANCLLFSFNYFGQLQAHYPVYPWQGLVVVAGTLGLLVIERLETLRFGEYIPARAGSGLLALRVIIIVFMTLVCDDSNTFIFGSLILPVVAAHYFGMKGAYFVAAVVSLLALLVFQLDPSFDLRNYWAASIVYLAVIIFGLTFAKMMTEEKALRHRAEQLVDELATTHRQIARMAKIEERNRLARDIHDSLGHYLTVVNVQLEKALVFRTKDPAEAEQAVHHAKRLANQALEEVRQSVGVLRTGPDLESFLLARSVVELVENVQSHLLKVNLELLGSEQGFSGESLMVLYRTTQEGLTNIQRHARASQASVQINFGPDQASLKLSDNGAGFEPDTLKFGNGLSGLKERVEHLGGCFRLESRPGDGTRLTISLPKNPAALTASLSN